MRRSHEFSYNCLLISQGPAGAAEGASAKVLPKHFSLQNKYWQAAFKVDSRCLLLLINWPLPSLPARVNCQDDWAVFTVAASRIAKEFNHLQSVVCIKMCQSCCPKKLIWTSLTYVPPEVESALPLTDFCVCVYSREQISVFRGGTFQSIVHYLLCKLNSCSHPASPAVQPSMTHCSHSKQTDGHYIQCFCKKKKKTRACNHFHEAQGCCSSPEAAWHTQCKGKKSCTRPPVVFLVTCFLQKK